MSAVMEPPRIADRNDDNAGGTVMKPVNINSNSAHNTRACLNPGPQARPIRTRAVTNKFSPEPASAAPPKPIKAAKKPAPPAAPAVIAVVEIKPKKPPTPEPPKTPVKEQPAIEVKAPETIPAQDGGGKPPPSKRRVRQTRTAKPVGFYDKRFDCLQQRVQAAKGAVLKMEEVALKGCDDCENVLIGTEVIETLFRPYAKALAVYKEAHTAMRRSLLLERKLAAEVWGDNEIASFRKGVYTVDKQAIEATLKKVPTVDVRNKPRSSSKRELKPVKRLIEDEKLNPPIKKRKIKSPVVGVKTKTYKATTPKSSKGQKHRKVVPATMATAVPQSPIKNICFKKDMPPPPSGPTSVSNTDNPVKSALPPAAVKPSRKAKKKRTEKRNK